MKWMKGAILRAGDKAGHYCSACEVPARASRAETFVVGATYSV
jgi:hypothetical protein